MTDFMDRIQRVRELSQFLGSITEEEIIKAKNENPWFTEETIHDALNGIGFMLEGNKVEKWLEKYPLPTAKPRSVGLILAGNLPLVGFHDLLCVYLSGHDCQVKLSSKDRVLSQLIISFLNREREREAIKTVDKLQTFDAVIATGSTNTSRYFHYYFQKYPSIIRKNRTSVAVINGNESDEELLALGNDVFSYYGLGCRNVSSILIPQEFDLRRLGDLWTDFSETINHHKYANNYDYQKSVFLINMVEHLDFGYLLLKESRELHSPIATLNCYRYDQAGEVDSYIEMHKDSIQCIIGTEVPFGKSQRPELWDYADGEDTMSFLASLD